MRESLAWFMESITTVANAYALDPLLVAAIVWTESRAIPSAYRYEPQFFRRYLSHLDQWKGQHPRRVSASYGLMQVLFVTAWEHGFREEPESLFLPKTNLHQGSTILQSLAVWAAGFDVDPESRLMAVLAAYNGGKGGNTPGTPLRNQQYALKAHAAYISLVESPS